MANRKNILYSLITVFIFLLNKSLIAQYENIKNDSFWSTTNGKPIYSQGGGIFTFTDSKSGIEKYYWYGAFYKEAELYRQDPSLTQLNTNFMTVTCYSSTDLVHWDFENNVLNKTDIDAHNNNALWMGRLGVVFIKEINKYAMFIQHNDGVLIALANSPTDKFKWHQKLDMTNRIGTPNTGDQTVFTDYDTGKSYLVYSYGRGRNRIYISEIGIKNGKVDLLDCNQIYKGKGREGNCMFKYNDKYYIYASNLYGWDSSYAYYLVADDIKGPYIPTNEMLITPGCMDDYTHVSQTGFFVNVIGSKQETVLYCGDRWSNFAGNGLGYNQWCPISFEGNTPYFNSLHSWNLNESTGEWHVAEDNNYVKNGSFEADRKAIPSRVKPIQEHLTGWVTKVHQGNVVVIGDSESPQLNYFNTQNDRKFIIGEKSLNIEDKVAFKRTVYQIIESTSYVELKDGMYNLNAKIKKNNMFHKLYMYAESGGFHKNHIIDGDKNGWIAIALHDIIVKNGKIEIGFYAHGEAGASCQVDDVTLVKSNG